MGAARTPALALALMGVVTAVAANCAPQSCGPIPTGYPAQCQKACTLGESDESAHRRWLSRRNDTGGAPAGMLAAGACAECSGMVCVASEEGGRDPPDTAPLGTKPQPEARVMAVAPGWEATKVHHTLLLPGAGGHKKPAGGWPVIVEYPGNWCGPTRPSHDLGRDCDSSWTSQGWGAGADSGRFIWLTLPHVTAGAGVAEVQMQWWGCEDPDGARCGTPPARYNATPTVRYTLDAVRHTLKAHGGNAKRVTVIGYSRGSISTQAIAFADDEVAKLYASRAVRFHPDGGQFDFARSPARTHHVGPQYV